jgi:DUF438 domain-containing protein
MQKECNQSKTLALVRILKRIDEGDDLRLVAKEVGRIAKDVGPHEIASAQDRLRKSGYPDAAVAQLWAAFVLTGVYEQKRNQSTGLLPHTHILQMVSAEHVMFRSLVGELVRALQDLRALEDISDTSLEFRRLAHTVHHLRGMKEHFDREEDVILPSLHRQGWAGLCRSVATDHMRLRASINDLDALVNALGEFEPETFKLQLATTVTGFHRCLSEHLSFEDGLLWPLALVVIDDPTTWHIIRAACDEIGYCGIHT